jgi:hypothetical protein
MIKKYFLLRAISKGYQSAKIRRYICISIKTKGELMIMYDRKG